MKGTHERQFEQIMAYANKFRELGLLPILIKINDNTYNVLYVKRKDDWYVTGMEFCSKNAFAEASKFMDKLTKEE